MTSKTIKFLVQGSSEVPYEVKFIHKGSDFNAYCSCPAGERGLICKHRIAILAGEVGSIVSKNQNDVLQIKSWLPGSSVEAAICNLEEAECEYNFVKNKVAQTKKALAKAMLYFRE